MNFCHFIQAGITLSLPPSKNETSDTLFKLKPDYDGEGVLLGFNKNKDGKRHFAYRWRVARSSTSHCKDVRVIMRGLIRGCLAQ